MIILVIIITIMINQNHETKLFSTESKGYSGISRITDLITKDITR